VNIQNITLIASAHEEMGELNSNTLYEILVGINPEIIFEELPFPRIKENILKFNINSIESHAIDKYIESYNITHVSVDYDFSYILEEINCTYRILYDIIGNDEKIKMLNLKKNFSIGRYGFKYLNSNDCLCIIEQIKSIEKDIIINRNDKGLTCLFCLLEKINKKREYEMVKNIFEYSSKNDYNDAVFIFGIAHKKSIFEIIEDIKNKYKVNIKWKLYVSE